MTGIATIESILEAGRHKLSTIKPSEWAEAHRYMDSSESRYKGRFSYDLTPYTREIVDFYSPDHPGRTGAVMKGAQIGFSTGVIENGIGYIISEQPGNVLMLTGHSDLSQEAVNKIDKMIDSCGIRHLIRSNVKRAKSNKTGDTDTRKDFPGGTLIAGSASNHKLLRQRSVMYGFIDDFEAAKKATDQSGNTRRMIEGRFAAYADQMKLLYISTPELRNASNIEPVYLLGDQRKWHWPCPHCGEYITLEWTVDTDSGDKAGMTWQTDDTGNLIAGTVGYICQKCGNFFDETEKYELNAAGKWIPTAKPVAPEHYSWHINALYSPPGMYDWEHYVRQYLEANPPGQPQDEGLQKVFVNLCLGLPFEPTGEGIKANELMRNIRPYEPYTVPEALSIQDGNGRIIALTCAIDLNGKIDDARMDYEVLAWSESGSTYSVCHGSIGTFIPFHGGRQNKQDREVWSYEHHAPNNVWKELDKVLERKYQTDTGRNMRILITGMDTGYLELQAFTYIDATNHHVVGLKGDKADRYSRDDADIANYKVGQSRPNLYIVRQNNVKDDLAHQIKLKWDRRSGDPQPPGYLNFPQPSGPMYQAANFFDHYESEHKVYDKNNNFIWVKKSATAQNHLWDCRVYNQVTRDILLFLISKENKRKITWPEFCRMVSGKN